MIVIIKPFDYNDVPIFEFLEEMERRGEDRNEYRTIW